MTTYGGWPTAATEREFERIQAELARRKRSPLTAAEIGRKTGPVQDRYKMGKHFETTIAAGVFRWQWREASIQREAALDGICVIRGSEDKASLSADDAVRCYKSLARVERVFRCMRGADLRLRPIFHRTPDHVRAHIFLCLLACYVERRMRQAWAELLFEDEQLEAGRQQRDAVAPAEPSAAVKKKKPRHSSEGWPVHSFQTLLDALATRCQNYLPRRRRGPCGDVRTTDRCDAASEAGFRAAGPVGRKANPSATLPPWNQRLTVVSPLELRFSSITRSKPTAFQAVSFKRGFSTEPRPRGCGPLWQ